MAPTNAVVDQLNATLTSRLLAGGRLDPTVRIDIADPCATEPTSGSSSRCVDGRGSGDLGECTQARVHDDDILHAYRNPTRVFDLDDLTMLIAAATNGHLLEIGVVEGDGIDLIVHAANARSPTRSSLPALRAPRGRGSAACSAHQHKRHNSATARSSRRADRRATRARY